jgi:hypothetical protein
MMSSGIDMWARRHGETSCIRMKFEELAGRRESNSVSPCLIELLDQVHITVFDRVPAHCHELHIPKHLRRINVPLPCYPFHDPPGG